MAFIPIAKYTFLVGAALVGSVFAREACTSNDFGFSGDSCKGSKCREKTEDSKEGSMLEPQESGLGFHSSSPPPPTVETLVEDFQNLGLEDNNDDNDNDYNNDNSDNEDNENENENVSWDSLGKEENDRDPQYPQRPNCSYYLRTGKCRYGLNCRYNHPARRQNQARRSVSQEAAQVKKKAKEKEKLSERAGQQECKYYHHTGGYKFGKACRYKHPREKIMVPPPDNFNFLDLPIRPGEKECSCYMRTGSCKYGTNCRFHHPEPSPVGEDLPPEYNSGSVSLHSSGISQQASASSWSSPATLNETVAYSDASSHVPMMFPPPHGVNPNLELNGYQPPAYPTERSTHPPPSFAMNSSTNRTDFSASYQQLVLEEFLERPGQAGCSYFMKNEDCRFRSASKHHHSKNSPACALSPMGLPLKPDQNICTHYSRHGFCKFGPACKYNHPVNYASSASSSVPTPSQLPSFGNFANCGWE